MKTNISLWPVYGFIFTSIAGALLHFLYDWTGRSVYIAPFSGVNESTWEHMKLLYFPLLVFALIQSRYFKDCKNFWCAKLSGISMGLVSIPIIFYTYNGAFGKSPDWLNISIFFVSAAIAFILEAYILRKGSWECKHSATAFCIICFIGVLFIVFTFHVPEIPLFKDPVSGGFGI